MVIQKSTTSSWPEILAGLQASILPVGEGPAQGSGGIGGEPCGREGEEQGDHPHGSYGVRGTSIKK